MAEIPYFNRPEQWCTIVLDTLGTIVHIVSMPDLVEETRTLVKTSGLTVDQICEIASVRPRWLSKFKAGGFKDPGINKVLRLNRALKRRQKRAA